MYVIATRHDLMYEVSVVSRFMKTPKETHWLTTKIIMRYVNGMKEYGIWYTTKN